MGLLDQVDETTKKEPYKFASGGIGEFMDEFNKPKQDQGIDEAAGLEDLPPEYEESEDDEPLEKLKATNSVANASASLLTIALDSTLSTVLGLYAGDEPSNYKADSDQREELQEAIAEYVKLKGGDIPPGLALILIVVSIYGSKGAMAFQFKKLKKETEEKDNQISELREKLSKYKEEKEE